MKFWNKVSAPLLLVGLLSPVLVNCDGLAIPGADCAPMKDGNFADLKLSADATVNTKLKGFLEAVFNYDKIAGEMEVSLIASCKEIGVAAGVDEAKLTAEPKSGEGAKAVCGAAADGVKAKLSAAGNASLAVEIGEPKCSVDVEAMNSCLGECGAAVEPGELSAACEGGEISGKCDAECKGTCTIEAGAGCEGKCGGDCSGKCEGKDSTGKCDGKCEGECSASCEMEGKAECSGSCGGECSAEMTAPKCSGEFKPPSVDAQCHGNCMAKTAGSASCTPPSISIKVEGEGGAELEALVKGLEVALPKVVEIQIGTAKSLMATGEVLVSTGQELPQLATKAGLQAVGCIAMAAQMAVSATASVSLNVEASANVSGSVGGGGEGEASGEASGEAEAK